MSIVFVLGGARSGKSRFAESLCQKPRTYIATAEAFDGEMKVRIGKHREQRGSGWATVEAPIDLAAALQSANGTILVDCLTIWLTNLMMKEKDATVEINLLVAALKKSRKQIVVVSNELGLGLVPEHGFSRRFRDLHGVMNQRVAEIADTVVFTVAGIPQVIKGRLPSQRRAPKAKP